MRHRAERPLLRGHPRALAAVFSTEARGPGRGAEKDAAEEVGVPQPHPGEAVTVRRLELPSLALGGLQMAD